jgi:hypothetical protein
VAGFLFAEFGEIAGRPSVFIFYVKPYTRLTSEFAFVVGKVYARCIKQELLEGKGVMNFKVKVANFVAVMFFGAILIWLGDAIKHGSVQTFELLFVPAFFASLGFVGFLVGLFAYGNGGEK